MSNITAQDLVSREVYYCVSSLIYELVQRAESFDAEDAEALYELGIAHRDYEEACREAGWEEVTDPVSFVFSNGDEIFRHCEGWEDDAWSALARDLSLDPELYDEDASDQEKCEENGWELKDDATFYNPETGETSEAEDWEELASEFDIDPHEWEAFEHWLVSDWFARKLTEHGYVVREVFGLTVWARGTTGQAIYMDGVIEDIAKELNSD
jgi:hypothetical protein